MKSIWEIPVGNICGARMMCIYRIYIMFDKLTSM